MIQARGLFSQVLLINLCVHVWVSMGLTMPLIPPLEPNTIRASIVLIFNTKTSFASHKLFPGPLHHVLVVLGGLVVQEGDRGESG